MLQIARAADETGIGRVVVGDHIVLGERLNEYADPRLGGDKDRSFVTGSDGGWLEPLTVLAAVAATTVRVRLATGVLLAALRRPVVLAKTSATLDVLSGGRLDLGVGVGWQRDEYAAAGLDFDSRGALLDQTLETCGALWTQRRASITVADRQLDGLYMMPKPIQPGGVPLWISGTVHPRVARRLARFGAGWIPWGDAARDPLPAIASMAELVNSFGGDMSSIQVTTNLPTIKDGRGAIDIRRMVERVPEFVAAGVTDFRTWMRLPPDIDHVRTLLAELVASFDDVLR